MHHSITGYMRIVFTKVVFILLHLTHFPDQKNVTSRILRFEAVYKQLLSSLIRELSIQHYKLTCMCRAFSLPVYVHLYINTGEVDTITYTGSQSVFMYRCEREGASW